MSSKSIVLATLAFLVGLAGVAQLNTSGLVAQETAPAASAATQPATEQAKPRRRLPNHYAKVVTPAQRQAIYKIQEGYNQRIEELKAELAKIEAQMNEEISGVLSPEQRERVAQLTAEAQERREAARRKAQQANEST